MYVFKHAGLFYSISLFYSFIYFLYYFTFKYSSVLPGVLSTGSCPCSDHGVVTVVLSGLRGQGSLTVMA